MVGVEPIPLVDLSIQHRRVAGEISGKLEAVAKSGAFIGGPNVAEFEGEYAKFAGVDHCIGVGNGTDAIELALRAIGIEPGAEVILPANTFIATAEAVVRAGCVPVLVDSTAENHLIDTRAAASAIGPQTGAVIGVDLYGQIAQFEDLVDRGVPVLEDAAQSQGATRHGQPAGSFGDIAATSFYPGKNLGAYGDAGAVLTNDAVLALTVRTLGSHGGIRKYEHRLVGMNSRLDTVQAVVLQAKLKYLAEWNEQRRLAAAYYQDLLGSLPHVGLPKTLDGNVHVWHLFVIEVPERNRVLEQLHQNRIGAGIHYPTPIHLTEAFSYLGYRQGDFPVAEAAAERILTLPLYPGITESQQNRVVETLATALAEL